MRKWEMILYSIGDLSKFTSKVVRYEDVIVNTFELFPKSFHLVGYPQYPDTESISKKIYDVLRVKGFVTTVSREYKLTKTGIEYAKILDKGAAGKQQVDNSGQFPPTYIDEIDRVVQLQGFRLFQGSHQADLIDRDYYDFYKVSARSNSRDVGGRQKLMHDVITAGIKSHIPLVQNVLEYKARIDELYGGIFENENTA